MNDFKWAALVPCAILLAWLAQRIVRQPLLGIFLIIICTIVFEHYEGNPPSFLVRPELYQNFNVTLGINSLVFNPIEVIIALMGIGWLIQATVGKLNGQPLLATSALGVLWMVMVIFSTFWGGANGGNVKIGLWILRPVFYFLSVAFFTYQLVRTERQVKWLLGCALAAITVKAFATVFLWLAYHHTLIHGKPYECYVSHEDTSFALYALWIVFGSLFLGAPRRLASYLYYFAPVIIAAVVFNDRRINFVTLILGCVLYFIAMPRAALMQRWRLVLCGLALPFFYVSISLSIPENALTKPVVGIVQGLQSEAQNKETDSSSQYRKLERYDLLHTIRAYPILGAGLGVKYLQPIELPHLPFEYYIYITHNQVLMIHAIMGPIAYAVFLLFYLSLFAQLLSFYRRLLTPWHRSIALAAASSVASWVIIGYFDMQLFFFRNSLFIGVVVALPACLMRIQEENERQSSLPHVQGDLTRAC